MELAKLVATGDIRALARAASLIEADTEEGRQLSEKLFPYTGRALSIGITGPPGAGKSTLISGLISAYREQGKSVGVLAIDPSSPYSHGALLGDRIRMLEHFADPAVFIRSLATRGRLGGVTATTLDLILLLDAAGRDIVLVETVGVGQDEIDIAHVAGVTVLVLSPANGDDIQAIKAGILEVADIIVVNKSDLAGADQLTTHIQEAQRLVESEIAPAPICQTSTLLRSSLTALLGHIKSAAEKKRCAGGDVDVWSERLRSKLRDELLAELPQAVLRRHAQLVAQKLEPPRNAIMSLRAAWLASLTR